MTVIEAISRFLGSASGWRITNRTGVSLARGLGGGYWQFDLREPSGAPRTIYYQQLQAGYNAGLSSDVVPPDTVRAFIGRSGQVFRRIQLGRELEFDDFQGPARAVAIGPLTILCVGSVGTIASVVLTGLPPASLAAQIWGSTLVGFVTPGGTANPRIQAEIVASIGMCTEHFPGTPGRWRQQPERVYNARWE